MREVRTLLSPVRPQGGALEPLWWAAMALRRELLGFRFDYPVDLVRAAGPKGSLHYHVYSDRLFFDAMESDDSGIPLQRSRHFQTYNPAYIAWYGLMSLERWLRGEDPGGRQTFLQQVEWLTTHAVERADASLVWPFTVDWEEGACRLKAPWVSAMLQGLVISALVRGYRITGEQRLLDQCRRACAVFEVDVEDGGVRTIERGGVIYEEYPGIPLPRVLDGYLFSLLGLYDLFAETNDPHVFQLFADGIGGLKDGLPSWDYREKWSWYGSHAYLCPPHYNKLNCALLASLASLSGEQTLLRYAEAWTPNRLTALGRAEVYLIFQVTKNLSRLRHLLRRRLSRQPVPGLEPPSGAAVVSTNRLVVQATPKRPPGHPVAR